MLTIFEYPIPHGRPIGYFWVWAFWSRHKHRTVRHCDNYYLRHRPTYQDLKRHRPSLPWKHEVTLYFAGPWFSSMGLIKLLDRPHISTVRGIIYVCRQWIGLQANRMPCASCLWTIHENEPTQYIPFTVYLCVAGTLRASVRDIRREQVSNMLVTHDCITKTCSKGPYIKRNTTSYVHML